MAMQKVEFSFPDEDDDGVDIELEPSSAKPLNKGRPDAETEVEVEEDRPKVKSKPESDDELDIEVVDDTPEKDRGRTPSGPPDEPTEDELESYSEKVQKRFKKLSKGYHDERREKEQAFREREELERLAKQLVEENRRLQGSVGSSQTALLEQAKRNAKAEVAAATRAYRDAYEAGDTDKVIEAQVRLSKATNYEDRVNNVKLPPTQEKQLDVKKEVPQDTPVSAPKADPKAAQWHKENQWFGSDDEMTSYALGLHSKLVKDGVSPQSEEYYETLNSRMRKVFPENFDDVEVETEKPRRSTSVVAPATRSVAPKKVRLTKTQVQIAKKLGVPLELYAKKVAEEMRKTDG